MKGDAIRDLIDRILRAAAREGGFSESVALEVERQFRADYRGCEIYVADDRKDAQLTARQRYLAGENISSITSSTGVSRATLYRLLKR